MAIVVDEHGTVVGVVTLENVLEQLIGPVEDEFDTEPPDITPDGDRSFIVQGSAPLDVVNMKFGFQLAAGDVDTFAGVLLERIGRVLQVGDQVDFDGMVAEVIEVEGTRAKRIRLTAPEPPMDRSEPSNEQNSRHSQDARPRHAVRGFPTCATTNDDVNA